MSQRDIGVEEIMSEFEGLFGNSFSPQHEYDVFGEEVRQWLTQTLQTERQKREEMVEAETIRCWEIGVEYTEDEVKTTLKAERERLRKLAVVFNPKKFPELANKAYIPVEALTHPKEDNK